jgi:hypothetical protein
LSVDQVRGALVRRARPRLDASVIARSLTGRAAACAAGNPAAVGCSLSQATCNDDNRAGVTLAITNDTTVLDNANLQLATDRHIAGVRVRSSMWEQRRQHIGVNAFPHLTVAGSNAGPREPIAVSTR